MTTARSRSPIIESRGKRNVTATVPRAITATIITLDEADNLSACIESVRAVCNEIIVVDSGSTDDTVQIAKDNGASVIDQPYLGDGPQKQVGAKHASNDWILSIDADERLETDALETIRSIDFDDNDVVYAFKRRNFVGTHWVKAAGFYPDYVPRLYNRKYAGYSDKKAHARISGGKLIKLQAHISHYTYRDYAHWVNRINDLSTRDAWAKYSNGKRSTPSGAAARAVFAFFKKLFLKGGIIQGGDGWLIAITSSFHVYMKYMKLSELSDDEDD